MLSVVKVPCVVVSVISNLGVTLISVAVPFLALNGANNVEDLNNSGSQNQGVIGIEGWWNELWKNWNETYFRDYANGCAGGCSGGCSGGDFLTIVYVILGLVLFSFILRLFGR